MRKQKLLLKDVTLIGVDCVDIDRLGKVSQICTDYVDFGAVKLLSSLESDGYSVIKIKPISSTKEYSKFIIRDLHAYVDTKFALIFQHDGFILNPDAWIPEFMNFDYIGAPWWYTDGKNVGNGGFSLWSKKLLELVASDAHIKKISPHDHHICRTYRRYLEGKGIRFAPEYLAQRFSVEGNLTQFKDRQNIWDGQFGFHALRKTDISKWLKENPKYSFIDNALKQLYRR